MPAINDAMIIRPLPVEDMLIRDAVAKQLDKINFQTVAFVAHADLDSAKVAVMVNLGSGWSFSGYLDKKYHGELSGGAEIIFAK